jgi:hypothetical protein
MTNPKLALIPSGYKTATVYSILPNNGGGDFTYERNGSATRVRKDGLIEEVGNDVPRLDYLGGGCPSLLLEPQRTNIQAYSENFSGVAWTPAWSTITANSSISPNGELTAYKLETDETIVPSGGFLAGFLQITANTEYTYSLFVKPDTTSICKIDLYDTVSSSRYFYGTVIFDMATETISTSLATASFDKLDGGWYRLKMTATSPNPLQGGGTGASISLTQAGSIFIWGAQMEAGKGATSYIKNVDDINGVTRLVDDLESTTTYSTENDVAWFLEFDNYTFENSFRPLMVVRNSGFTQTMDLISYNSGSDYYFRIRATNQSALQTIINLGQDAIQMFTRNKVAIRLYGSNFEIYVNGTREYTGTSDDGDWTILNNSAILNDFGSSAEAPSAKLYDFRVYDQTMTQTELEQLTTI